MFSFFFCPHPKSSSVRDWLFITSIFSSIARFFVVAFYRYLCLIGSRCFKHFRRLLTISILFHYVYKVLLFFVVVVGSVVVPNTLTLDPDLKIWPNLDPDPDPGPDLDPGLCCQFWEKIMKNNFREKQLSLKTDLF